MAYTGKRLSLRFGLWLFSVPVGLFLFMAPFLKRELFAYSIGAGFAVLLVGFGLGIYLLPTINANKDNLFVAWALAG